MRRTSNTGGGSGSGRIVVGEYQLAGKLGRGGSGVVHKAIHVRKGHIVAVKLISVAAVPKEEISSIEMEIKLMRDLRHPNIVKYIDSKLEGSELCIVLEYVEGGSLAKIMHDVGQGTLPATLVALYLSKMLRGLVYLHSEGVIHRDIKAANILVDRDGEVRLADFGVAISTRGRTADGAAAAAGGAMTDVVGTPYWMAPEVIEMSGATDRSDVWSVGCTVIELLTGAPPYADLPQVPALFRIVQDLHPPLPDLAAQDPVLHDFLMRCFQKDPQERVDAQSLSEHRWLLEMRQSIDETISHDIEAPDGDMKKNSWPLDEESDEDDDDVSTPRAQAGLVPVMGTADVGGGSSLSGSAAASTVASPEQQALGQGGGAVLTSTISMHRELSDTIRSGRGSVPGAGWGSTRRPRPGTDGSGGGDRWDLTSAGGGANASMTSLSSLSALASGSEPPAASGHGDVGLVSSPFDDGAVTVPSSICGYGGRQPDPHPGAGDQHQTHAGSTSRYSYAQVEGTGRGAATGAMAGRKEGSLCARDGGNMVNDNAAAAAAALERDIQPQAPEDWEQAFTGGVGAPSVTTEDADATAAAVDDADEETKEARRWIELLKAPNRSSGGGATGSAPSVKSPSGSHHQACVGLVTLFIHSPAKKSCLIAEHAIIPLIEILEQGQGDDSDKLQVQVAAMILINKVTRGDPYFQEKLCLIGLLPVIAKLVGQLSVNSNASTIVRASTKTPRWGEARSGALVGSTNDGSGVHRDDAAKARGVMAEQLRGQLLAEVVRFVAEICRPDSSSLALQMFISCQGLTVLTNFLAQEGLFMYPANPAEAAAAAAAAVDEGLHATPTATLGQRTLMHLMIDSIWHILNRVSTAGPRYGAEKRRGQPAAQPQLDALLPNLDICRLLVKAGLLQPLSVLLCRWIHTGDEIYQEKVVNLFVQFARCDEHIQEAMATRAVLEGMLFALDELSHLPSVLLNLLHVVCRLTMCAAAWDALEEADAIGRLVALTNPELDDLFAYSKEDAAKIGRAALLSLFYLCGGKAARAEQFRARQEKAALSSSGSTPGNGDGDGKQRGGNTGGMVGKGDNSLIKYLQFYIHAGGSANSTAVGLGGMESLALHMFCALPFAGRTVRTRLWQESAHLFYIALLEHRHQHWRQQALEALALWLADGNASHPKRTELERVILQPKYVARLVPLFKTTSVENGSFVGILSPYVQLLSSSPALARACSPIAADILTRLGNDDGVFDACCHTFMWGTGNRTVIDLLKILQLLLINLRSPASFIEEHSLDFALHDMYERKRWEQKPMVGQVATQVLHVIERFR